MQVIAGERGFACSVNGGDAPAGLVIPVLGPDDVHVGRRQQTAGEAVHRHRRVGECVLRQLLLGIGQAPRLIVGIECFIAG